MKKLISLSILILTGCTSVQFKNSPKTGITLNYSNSVFRKQINEVTISTNGVITLKGVQSDAAYVADAVANAVGTAVSKTVHP